jgi:hypothetical protein
LPEQSEDDELTGLRDGLSLSGKGGQGKFSRTHFLANWILGRMAGNFKVALSEKEMQLRSGRDDLARFWVLDQLTKKHNIAASTKTRSLPRSFIF